MGSEVSEQDNEREFARGVLASYAKQYGIDGELRVDLDREFTPEQLANNPYVGLFDDVVGPAQMSTGARLP